MRPLIAHANLLRPLLLVIAALLLAVAPAFADDWPPPARKVYHSVDRQARFTVTPRAIESALAHFGDKARGREPTGRRRSGAAAAQGLLERRQADGRWATVWERPLVNDVAPVNALVADGGFYAVTFDDWGMVGHGEHVVVIYDGAGERIRSLGLADLLPPDHIEMLPRTTSSIRWGNRHRLSADGTRLILSIVIPSAEAGRDGAGRVEREIDLASGRPVAPPSAEDD